MSNKLTREVRYLSESDRPKKVEPLSFSKWYAFGSSYSEVDAMNIFHQLNLTSKNDSIAKYATYLQEFSAEEKAVEFIAYIDRYRKEQSALAYPKEYDSIIYLGKDSIVGDMFSAMSDGSIVIYYGHLHSGKF